MTEVQETGMVTITVMSGARIHAADPYWPANGRPIRKARTVRAWLEHHEWPIPDTYWTWIDPKTLRPRWTFAEWVEVPFLKAVKEGATEGRASTGGERMSEARQRCGAALIVAERQRQVDVEGWTPEHDDAYTNGELVQAAGCYIAPHASSRPEPPASWPWDWAWWKPSQGDRVRDLVKAGALIAAEIDRLQRALAVKEESA